LNQRPPASKAGALTRLSYIQYLTLCLVLPVGGDLEYADELTLGRALEGRRDVD
jgi:recombination protein RecR